MPDMMPHMPDIKLKFPREFIQYIENSWREPLDDTYLSSTCEKITTTPDVVKMNRFMHRTLQQQFKNRMTHCTVVEYPTHTLHWYSGGASTPYSG